ncbi:MAG: ketol-acid reductoisomerase [Candidatus Methylomirabilales bacterium]
MVKVYYEEHADLSHIAHETVAIIGYGIQGQAQALNLRDSGLTVVVGNRDDSYRERAAADGFEVLEIPEAAATGDIINLLIPDEAQAEVYTESIQQALAPGKALVFAHGFAIRYGVLQPPEFADLLLLAPRMPGKYVRELFIQGRGVPTYVYVGQDHTGRGLQRVLALAKGIGATRAGAFEISFAQELELDHFSEHFTYPLIVRALQLSYEVLIEEGYPAEAVLMELHGSGELGEVLREAARIGLYPMIETHASPACQYGIHAYARRVLPDETKNLLRQIVHEIRDGSFARDLLAEQRNDYPRLRAMTKAARAHELTATESRLRQLIRLPL